MSRFVLDWLEGDERFLPRGRDPFPSPCEAGRGKRAAVSGVLGEERTALATALIQSNQRWGSFVKDDVERWKRGESAAIVAGQQVGFAGGPLYTIIKLASLLKMKRELEAAGTPATIFFWLATEDHDFSEVATIKLPSRGKRQTDLVTLRASHGVDFRRAVGTLPIPEELIRELLAFYDGMPRPSWLREGITFRESFAELIATVIPSGVVLVDALLPELRRTGAPLLEAIAGKWNDVQSSIAARSRELEAAGYKPQVVAREGEYTLLFRFAEDGTRELLTSPPAAIDAPERLSTSALTRPLLQDFVLRPDVFIGGPAEVSYYAQIAPLYDLLGITLPRVALRAHALAGPRRIVRYYERFGIDPRETFASVDELLAAREPAGVAEVQNITTEAQKQLFDAIGKIRDIALPADHALGRSINRSIGHLDYHFRKLTERAVRGLTRKDRERYAALRELVATFYPDRTVQDRAVAWFALWCDFGNHLLDALIECVEPDSGVCRIVGL
jgi:bacillithiol biosynthesis cysteine-adding enzyme BshC